MFCLGDWGGAVFQFQLCVLHFRVCHFYALSLGLFILRPAISCPAILMVRHFHVRHF